MKTNTIINIFLIGLIFAFTQCSQKSASETEETQLEEASSIIVVDTIKINKFENEADACLLPRLRHTTEPENFAVAEINKKILEHFGLNSFENPILEDFVHAGLTFSWEATSEVFYLKYEGEMIVGRSHHVEGEIVFDLNNGKLLEYTPIPFQALFTPEGYFEFLNKHWLDGFEKELKQGEVCAEMDAICSSRKLKYDIRSNEVIVSLDDECFPSYARSCEPYYEKRIKVKEIQSYLSEAGKILINEENANSSKIELLSKNNKANELVKDVIYLFGKIDYQYPFSMALENKNGVVSGFYYYDNKKSTIELKGNIHYEYLELTEYTNGNISGHFQFILHDGFAAEDMVIRFPDGNIRYLEGSWLNADKTQMYAINFTDNVSNLNQTKLEN